MKPVQILAIVAAVWATSVSAQTVTDLKVEPLQAKVGEAVKATVNFDVGAVMNCGLHIVWGDGAVLESKINQTQDVPTIATHYYAKPGTYTIVAEPKRVGSVLKCNGKNQKAVVTIAAAPLAAAPVTPAAPAASAAVPAKAQTSADVCPAGWSLAKPGVSKKTKAFTCTAMANTKLPETKVVCPGDLTYFENVKKGQLGCRP